MNAESGGGAGPAAEPGTPGVLLRTERERRGLSVQQVAEDLHLDPWVIEALEANRFLALGAPVYARGHLRKYALLLGLAPAVLIERYEALTGTPSVPTPIPATVSAPVRAKRRSLKVPLTIVAALILAAVVAWLVFELLKKDESSVASGPVSPPVETPAALEHLVEAARPAASGIKETISAVTTPVRTAAAPPNAASGDRIRLRLYFSEPSWTEVYDAEQKRLLFDMGVPGRAYTVAGAAPLHVNLGLASAASAEVGEQPIVIPRRAGRDSARFVIEADGSVKMDNSVKTVEREALR